MTSSRALATVLAAATLLLCGCGERTSPSTATEVATDPTPEPTSEPTPVPSATVPALPDDLDLTAGLPRNDSDVTVTPQAPDAEGVGQVEMCGRVVWPVAVAPEEAGVGAVDVRRLVAAASGPEWFEGRELLAYADPEVAQQVMAPAREALRTCRRFDDQVWTPLAQETGHDSVTMGLTYVDGLGSSVLQLTRVGAAVLLVATYGEGSLDSLPDQAARVTATTRTLVPQLCALTEGGC